ncbi:MAG: hypothetical protein ACXVDD_26270, partial [Polyangia bacterium]
MISPTAGWYEGLRQGGKKMKLQLFSIVSLLGLVVGCTGAPAESIVGETSADVRLGSPVAKKRDHRPAKTPLDR